MTHEAIAITSGYEDFSRNDTGWGGVSTTARTSSSSTSWRGSTSPPLATCARRAPPRGVYGLESAMDELAIALKLDPVELRLECYSEIATRTRPALHQQAIARVLSPGRGSVRLEQAQSAAALDARRQELVGWGMASGVWEALQMPMAARIVLTGERPCRSLLRDLDIGTGTYTILAQVAADSLGLPIENITVKLGDSSLPQAPVEGGSWMAASASHAVMATAEEIRTELLASAKTMSNSPLGGRRARRGRARRRQDGGKHDQSARVSITDAMRHSGADRIVKEKRHEFDQENYRTRATRIPRSSPK